MATVKKSLCPNKFCYWLILVDKTSQVSYKINISTSWAQNVHVHFFYISCLNYLILLITNTLNIFFFLFKQTHTGRYLYLNAIANQLRYPNSHTHYFSCTLLYLFAEANSEAIQEQITRYVKYVLYDEKKG